MMKSPWVDNQSVYVRTPIPTTMISFKYKEAPLCLKSFFFSSEKEKSSLVAVSMDLCLTLEWHSDYT